MRLAIELAHLLMAQAVKPGDWVVDATVGNGHDTHRLAHIVGPTGRVFGFDVQAAALATAQRRVADMPQVSLFLAGHEAMAAHLPVDATGRLTALMFNLGYLPGTDKAIVTRPETTLAALNQALTYLAVGGQISVVLYPGHTGGAVEAAAVRSWAAHLSGTYASELHARLNSRHPAPELLTVERTC
jgi:predicted methyltransferase